MSAAPRRELQRCQILIFLCMPLDYICNCLDLLSSWYNNICCWRLKSRVWNNSKKSETCWRIIIIPAGGLQEQNVDFRANKHFYDRQLCIGSVSPGAAETHTGCRAIEPYCIYWLKIYHWLLMSLSQFLYCENILRSGLYCRLLVQTNFVCAFVQTNVILSCELFVEECQCLSGSHCRAENVFSDAD